MSEKPPHEPVVRQDTYDRLMEYEQLRLSGLRPVDAAREIGLCIPEGSMRYERWFKRRHGLPPGAGDAFSRNQRRAGRANGRRNLWWD